MISEDFCIVFHLLISFFIHCYIKLFQNYTIPFFSGITTVRLLLFIVDIAFRKSSLSCTGNSSTFLRHSSFTLDKKSIWMKSLYTIYIRTRYNFKSVLLSLLYPYYIFPLRMMLISMLCPFTFYLFSL